MPQKVQNSKKNRNTLFKLKCKRKTQEKISDIHPILPFSYNIKKGRWENEEKNI